MAIIYIDRTGAPAEYNPRYIGNWCSVAGLHVLILWIDIMKILYSAADIYWHCLMLISVPSNTCLTSVTFCDLIIYLIASQHISVLLKVLQSTNVTEKQPSGVFLSQCHSSLTLLRDIIWRKKLANLVKILCVYHLSFKTQYKSVAIASVMCINHGQWLFLPLKMFPNDCSNTQGIIGHWK